MPLSDLKVENLRKKIGDFYLEADFSIRVGERVALLGRSGSGKTSLLRVLAGLESLDGLEDQGRILLGAEDLTFVPPQKRDFGLVFQDQALFLGLSVLENVAFGLKMRGVSKEERENLALQWLDRVGMKSKVHSSVGKLSGGERQRIAFVRASIWKPRLLLLDEPFSALDTELRVSLRKELLELHQLWPVPLLLVTHDEMDVQAVATRRLSLKWDSGSSVRKISSSVFL